MVREPFLIKLDTDELLDGKMTALAVENWKFNLTSVGHKWDKILNFSVFDFYQESS